MNKIVNIINKYLKGNPIEFDIQARIYRGAYMVKIIGVEVDSLNYLRVVIELSGDGSNGVVSIIRTSDELLGEIDSLRTLFGVNILPPLRNDIIFNEYYFRRCVCTSRES